MIQHVALETRASDVERELAFWALLGFERVDLPADLAGRMAWVRRGGTQVHLLHADDPVVAPRGHVAVVADDHAATVGRLERAGHAVQPRAPHWGAARSYVRTPAGHLVEVMAAPPPA